MNTEAVNGDSTPRPPARDTTRGKSTRPNTWVCAGLLAALALSGILSIMLGTRSISPETVWNYITGQPVTAVEHSILSQRAVRTLWAATIGAALAIAGAGMQGVTRNPLGDPGILGVNAGAAFAVVTGIAFLDATSATDFALLALIGAAAASVLVYALASIGRDGASPVKLALMGAAISAGLGSLTSAFMISSNDVLDSLRTWQVGTVAGSDMANYFPGIIMITAGAAILLLGSRAINNFALGDDMAESLGENVALKRFTLFIGITLLCGTATSMAGPIAFIGLMAPHALRTLVGPDYRLLIPFSGLFGAALLMLADTVGRIILPPEEVQVGVTMIVIGVPVFIYLVRNQKAVNL